MPFKTFGMWKAGKLEKETATPHWIGESRTQELWKKNIPPARSSFPEFQINKPRHTSPHATRDAVDFSAARSSLPDFHIKKNALMSLVFSSLQTTPRARSTR
jgi:hypothetical protein